MAFDPAAVTLASEMCWATMPLTRVVAVLGVNAKMVRSLVELGVLSPVHSGPKEGWGRWAFDLFEVNELLERLQPTLSTDDPVTFDQAVHAVGIKGGSGGDIVKAAVQGHLPVCGLGDNAIGLRRLIFDRHRLRDICRKLENCAEYLSQAAVCRRLEVKPEVVSHLIAVGLLERDTEGIKAASVNGFDERYVTGARLVREQRTSPRALAQRLAAQGIDPVVGPQIDGSRQNIYERAKL